MKGTFTTIAITLAFLLPTTAQAKTVLNDIHSSRSTKIKYKFDLAKIVPNYKFFIAIGRCEQPGDGKWGIAWRQNYNYSYPGGLGVWAPLWTEEGIEGTDMAPSANKATPIEQMIHAQRIINKYGVWAWGCTDEALAVANVVDVPDWMVAPRRPTVRKEKRLAIPQVRCMIHSRLPGSRSC